MSHYISVDPGAHGMGIAVWDSQTWKSCCQPLHVWLMRSSAVDGWLPKVEYMVDKFNNDFLMAYNPQKVMIEFPAQWGTLRGSAASSRGNIIQLAFITGALYYCACEAVDSQHVDVVTTQEWKGTLTKDQVNNRIKKLYGDNPTDLHGQPFVRDIWDAVGIGLWWKGHF